MAAEKYQDEGEEYELRLLKDIRASVRSIDGKVEEILEELKEHLPEVDGPGNGWAEKELYDHDLYEDD
jgi:hypothetical protein